MVSKGGRAKRKRADSLSRASKRKMQIVRMPALNHNQLPSNTSISNRKGPLKTTQRATLIYQQAITLTIAGVSTAAVSTFAMNGCTDPFTSGTGTKPRGFDQLMSLYDHYVVIGTRCTVFYDNQDGTNFGYLVLSVKDDATTSTSPNSYMEERNVSCTVIGPRASGTNCGSLDIQVNPNKFLGRASPMSDPQLKGTAVSNPQELAHLHIAAFGDGIATQPANINCRVRIEYEVVFIEPKQPPAS